MSLDNPETLEKVLDKDYIHSRLDGLLGEYSKEFIDSKQTITLFWLGMYQGISKKPINDIEIKSKGDITNAVKINVEVRSKIYEFGYEVGQVLYSEFGILDIDDADPSVPLVSQLSKSSELILEYLMVYLDPNYNIEGFREANRKDLVISAFINKDKLM